MTTLGSAPRRFRIGMVTPSSNTCLEPTTYRLLDGRDDVTVHFSRVPVTRIATDSGSNRQFDAEPMAAAARQLADARVDLVVWNGTAGSWLGAEHDVDLARQLSRAAGCPATTSTLAMLEACQVYGVTRLGLATPYQQDVSDRIVAEYARHGIDVVHESHLGIADNEAFGRVGPATVEAQLRTVAGGGPHAVAVLCTNVHGAVLAQRLEDELGIPVFDSVTVTLWDALRRAGLPGPGGCGTLLRDGLFRAEAQAVCQALLEDTGADRTTLRLDLPEHGLQVDLTAAESLRAGVRPIRREGSLDQRRLNTVVWLEEHRRNLVQPRFGQDPNPPAALIDVYGVRAQMLGPVQAGGQMVGWLSAHSLTEREWSDQHEEALDRARKSVEALVSAAREEGLCA